MPSLKPPIISIIGDVIRMAKSLDWFSARPWFGKRVWVTSPEHSARFLTKKFSELGADAIQCPVMTIESPMDWSVVDATMRKLDRFDWIIFSSTVGVDRFFARLGSLGKDGRSLYHNKIAAVGTGTAAAIAAYSMHCDMVPQLAGSHSLANILVPECANKRFLFVRNPDGETEAIDRLRAAGAEVESMDIYRQVLVPSLPTGWVERCASGKIDAIAVTSKNIASHTVALLGDVSRSQRWLSLTPAITAQLHELGCTDVKTASEPSFDALVRLD